MTEQSTQPTGPADQPGPILDAVHQAVRDAAGKDGATAADTWAHTTLYTRTGAERATAASVALRLIENGADPGRVGRCGGAVTVGAACADSPQ
jgi:hypothetical protein